MCSPSGADQSSMCMHQVTWWWSACKATHTRAVHTRGMMASYRHNDEFAHRCVKNATAQLCTAVAKLGRGHRVWLGAGVGLDAKQQVRTDNEHAISI